jgi:hypothetical protein
MAEMEVPMEQTQETLHEHAHHAAEPWIGWVALTTALIAALAALTVLVAGQYADKSNESLGKSFNQWAYFQAKGVKAAVLSSKMELLEGMGKEVSEKDKEKLKEYGKEQAEIKAEAEKEGAESEHMQHKHLQLAYGVTMFQVAIAVAAIAVLTKKPPMWYVGLAFSVGGILFLVRGTLLI